MSVRNCPTCGRNNGVKHARCMYCGSDLPSASPASPSASSEDKTVSPERARELLAGLTQSARALMPPDVLESLKAAAAKAPHAAKAPAAKAPRPPVNAPPVVRSRLGFTGLGRRGTTSTTLPPVKGPLPPPFPEPDRSAKAQDDDSLEPLPSDRLAPLPPAPIDADLPEGPPTLENMRAVSDDSILERSKAVEDDSILERSKAVEDDSILPISTADIRPLDTGEMDAYSPDALTSFYDLEPVRDEALIAPIRTVGPITRALRRGGGPFGPRDTPFRLILLPEDHYRSKVHWLRHRLADTTGIDLYTAAQTLSKEVPSYLFGCDDAEDARERAEHLRRGELSVLVLDRDGREDDIEPLYVTEASGDGPGPVTFTTGSGALIEVKRAGFAWACFGAIEPDGDRQSLVRERTFRGRSVPDRPTFDGASGSYHLLDLYLTRASQPIRIRSDRFDFGCLGSARELAATLNLRRMLSWLSADPAEALPLDERFKRVPRLRVSSNRSTPDGDSPVPQRELEFTEYGLILNAQHRGATTA